ncbi:MAG: hypothetical protein ACP5D1_10585 [Bacteroidales bacterium]
MKKILALLIIVATGWMVSCNKDEAPTVAENKQTLENLATQMDEDMSVVVDEEGFNALVAFDACMSIHDPVGAPEVKKSLTAESNTLTLKDFYRMAMMPSIDPGFDFQSKVGTYEWNAGNQGWVITQNDPNDKIVFLFPNNGPQGTVNNVTLTIYDFQEVMITDEYGSWYNPTRVEADLYYEDVLYLDLLFEASWNTDNGEPNSLFLELFLKPYTFTGSFNRDGSDVSLEAILKLGKTRVVSAGIDVGFDSAELDNVQDLAGYLQYRKVKLEGDLDIASLEGIEGEPTVDQLNEYVDLTLYTYPDMYKMADVEFYYDETNQRIDIQLVFTDGTTVPASEYLDSVMEVIEQRMQEIQQEFTQPR